MKACKKCETLKDEQDFYNTDSSCKECRKANKWPVKIAGRLLDKNTGK